MSKEENFKRKEDVARSEGKREKPTPSHLNHFNRGRQREEGARVKEENKE